MSGHANFNTISGYTTLHLQPNPQVDDGINVAGNQQVGGVANGEVGVGPQEEPQNAQVDVQAETTKALVRQLDILLARAAASATLSVDATAVKAALGELNIPADKRGALDQDTGRRTRPPGRPRLQRLRRRARPAAARRPERREALPEHQAASRRRLRLQKRRDGRDVVQAYGELRAPAASPPPRFPQSCRGKKDRNAFKT